MGRGKVTINDKVITKKHPKVMVKYTTFVGTKDSEELKNTLLGYRHGSPAGCF
jgi:hypothetical protein